MHQVSKETPLAYLVFFGNCKGSQLDQIQIGGGLACARYRLGNVANGGRFFYIPRYMENNYLK